MITALTLFSSCSNNHEGNIIKNGEVVIDLLGVSSADNIQKEGSIAYDKNGDQVTQEFERIPFGDEGISLDAKLKPLDALGSFKNEKLGAVTSKPLSNGIKYNVVVYNSDGTFRIQKTLTVGDGDNKIENLPVNESLTFLVYSIGSTTSIPLVDPTLDLSAVTIDLNESVLGPIDFMFYKTSKTLTKDLDNKLSVVLEHKYTELTVEIDARNLGSNITNVSNATLSSHYSNIVYEPVSNKFTYSNPSTKTISFPTGNAQVRTSNTFIIAAESNTTSILTLNITINGTTKTITYNNVRITPGQKYKFSIIVRHPQEITAGLLWASGNLYRSSSDNNYYFQSPGVLGDWFFYNRILPIRQESRYNYNTAGDVCTYARGDGYNSGWRLPTYDEFYNLGLTQFQWATVNGKQGVRYKNSVFFPLSGLIYAEDINSMTVSNAGSSGWYWGSPSSSDGTHLYFTNVRNYSSVARYGTSSSEFRRGFQIRCVHPLPNK